MNSDYPIKPAIAVHNGKGFPPVGRGLQPFLTWAIIVAGIAVLYAPTFYRLSEQVWHKPEYMHGPLVLIAVLWLFWRQRNTFLSVKPNGHYGGLLLLGAGLLLQLAGHAFDIWAVEVGSLIPVLAGVIYFLLGWPGLRPFWFPLLYFLFLIPLPSSVVDVLTMPLKEQISATVAQGLYLLGYPIARSGVVLSIGPYQLLIADACSGINSMFSLSALGLLYAYLRGSRKGIHNLIFIASILPIAYIANLLRVTALVLITYYLGDAAGQGFLHDFAGLTEFAVALVSLFGLDSLLGRRGGKNKGTLHAA